MLHVINTYKELFGEKSSQLLSIYEHDHDHVHSLRWNIVRKDNMFDDFLFRAIIAGIGIALVTGPLGCFVVWRRLSFFGDTLAHSALLGVLLSIAFDINISLNNFCCIISGCSSVIKITEND